MLVDTEDDLPARLLTAHGPISALADIVPEQVVALYEHVRSERVVGASALSGRLRRVRAMTKEHTSAGVLERIAEARHGHPMGTAPTTGPHPAVLRRGGRGRACDGRRARLRRSGPARAVEHSCPRAAAGVRGGQRGPVSRVRGEEWMRGLDGQVAIVTGGGSGIGEATAMALAREGVRVAVVGRRHQPLEEVVRSVTSAGGTAFAAPVDVADPEAVPALAHAVVERWGRVDLLVNNAGINVPQRDMASLSVSDWNAVVQINLTGTFLVTQAVLPFMRRQQAGTVVNVSSMAGYRPSALSGPAYNATKAGVNALTESVNLAERRHGIRACAICPGEVATPILDKRPQPPSPEARATMLQPEDVAATILFVAALPQRAAVELLTIQPTAQRDVTGELG